MPGTASDLLYGRRPATAAAAQSGRAAAAALRASQCWEVVLTGFDNSDSGTKLRVIKVVQHHLGIRITPAKNLVDDLPAVLGGALTEEQARDLVAALAEAKAQAFTQRSSQSGRLI